MPRERYLFYDPADPHGTPKAAHPISAFIQERFPTVGDAIKNLKRSDYRNCARQLQRLERKLVIDGAAAETLSKLGSNHCVATIHDSILVADTSDVEVVCKALKRAFRDYMLEPSLDVVDYAK